MYSAGNDPFGGLAEEMQADRSPARHNSAALPNYGLNAGTKVWGVIGGEISVLAHAEVIASTSSEAELNEPR